MAICKGTVVRGAYFDSVRLMIVGSILRGMDGVAEGAAVMGNQENKDMLQRSGLLTPACLDATENDLIMAVMAETDALADAALKSGHGSLANITRQKNGHAAERPYSLDGALKLCPAANLALISTAGKYAAHEARKALQHGLHVMIFSDNVSIAEEIALKTDALKRNLLVMGPDCGSAIINGAPLAFANVVSRGSIGIVAASGTGLQEVSCLIHHLGGGISQALGTGGRDLRAEVGGAMFLAALYALAEDPATEVIVLISKPPAAEVLRKITAALENVTKPTVAILLGGAPELLKGSPAVPAATLEDAARLACALACGKTVAEAQDEVRESAAALTPAMVQSHLRGKTARQKYIRALYSGGTLCDEAQLLLAGLAEPVYSNTPVRGCLPLADLDVSCSHTVIDMGDDAFTVGRPHPMIDISYRNQRLIAEAKDPDVALLLIDIVLGYGSHPDPLKELLPVLAEIRQAAPAISIIAVVVGTRDDPQNRHALVCALEEIGVVVASSNAAGARLARGIAQSLQQG